MAQALRILILEDRPTDADLEEFELQEAGLDFESRRVMTEREYIRELQSFSPQLILSDYDLPQYNGDYALTEARRHCPDTPFILVSGALGEEQASEILARGARDFVFKGHLERLAPAVKRAVAEADVYRAYKRAEEELLEACKTLESKVEERTRGLQNEIAASTKKAESLKQSEEKLRLVLDASGQGIWDWDLINKELIWSGRCRQIFGFSPDLKVGYESFLDVIHPEDRERIEKAIANALKRKEDCDIEMRILWPDDTTRWVALKGKGTYVNGKPVRMIGVMFDITERRRMENDLTRDEKLESVGRLAGGIAHDFNNLLAVIQGNIELTRLKINGKDTARDNLKDAEVAIRQAAELTKRLITFAGGGAPFKKLCDIRELIVNTIGICITGESVEKAFSLDNNLWPVEIDEGQMRQVFRNMAINAREAMPEGGTITVKAKNFMVGHDNPLRLSEGPYVRISLEDTGEGIAEKNLPRIFDPYFSTKQRGAEKGMGLGLSVCYSIVSKHDGCITVQSNEGCGSTFDIYLPAVGNGEDAQLKS